MSSDLTKTVNMAATLPIPMRGYEVDVDGQAPARSEVTNPHEGL